MDMLFLTGSFMKCPFPEQEVFARRTEVEPAGKDFEPFGYLVDL
jgi:hypothetical protein